MNKSVLLPLLYALTSICMGASGVDAGEGALLKQAIERYNQADVVDMEYTIQRPASNGYQVVRLYFERDGRKRTFNEILTFSNDSMVPKRQVREIENDRGVFMLYPRAGIAILDPVKSAKLEYKVVNSKRVSGNGYWRFLGLEYKAELTNVKKICDAAGIATSIVYVQNVTEMNLAQGSDSLDGAEQQLSYSPLANVQYICVSLGAKNNDIIGYSLSDKNGKVILERNSIKMKFDVRCDEKLFEVPESYEIFFPENMGEFVQFLSSAERKTQRKGKPKNESK